jgi:hypothetical protein
MNGNVDNDDDDDDDDNENGGIVPVAINEMMTSNALKTVTIADEIDTLENW